MPILQHASLLLLATVEQVLGGLFIQDGIIQRLDATIEHYQLNQAVDKTSYKAIIILKNTLYKI